MSATRGWRPVTRQVISFKEPVSGYHFEKLEEEIGSSGIVKRADTEMLRHWFKFSGDKFWSELADLADAHGEIELCEEY